MSDSKATIAQNVAILGNALQLGAEVIGEIAGGDVVGNSFGGKPVEPATIQEWLDGEIRSTAGL